MIKYKDYEIALKYGQAIQFWNKLYYMTDREIIIFKQINENTAEILFRSPMTRVFYEESQKIFNNLVKKEQDKHTEKTNSMLEQYENELCTKNKKEPKVRKITKMELLLEQKAMER